MGKPTYEELEAQVKQFAALAEENSIMRKLLPDYISVPATDNFLASLRAEGVEMLRQHPAIQLCSLTHVCDEVAAQLRSQSEQVKGVQS